jgi:hypothetical protein
LIDKLLADIGIKVGAFDKAEEELVNDLQMWPSKLEDGLILFWIKRVARRVDLGWDGSEEICGKLLGQLYPC